MPNEPLQPIVRNQPLFPPILDQLDIVQPSPDIIIGMIKYNYLKPPRRFSDLIRQGSKHFSNRQNIFIAPFKLA